MTGRHSSLVVLLLTQLFVSSVAADDDPSHLVRIGQTTPQIAAMLGEPDKKETVTKSERPIWGPEEEFWDKIPDGARLEVWSYHKEAGQLNLYFLNGSDKLNYKAFAPQGRVYEAE